MEVLNLITYKAIFGVGFPLHTVYVGEYLHFRYLKWLVKNHHIMGAKDHIVQNPGTLLVRFLGLWEALEFYGATAICFRHVYIYHIYDYIVAISMSIYMIYSIYIYIEYYVMVYKYPCHQL